MWLRTAAALLPAAPLAHAPEATATITGRVLDAAPAVIAGAEVVVTHVETGATCKTATDSEGNYVFTLLPIDSCELGAGGVSAILGAG